MGKNPVGGPPPDLYRSLKRLRRDGIVEEVDASDDDAPPEQRRYFGLTPGGRAVVAAEAARLERLTRVARDARLLDEGATTG